MRLRPASARWFETYVPRDQTVLATEVLARTGVVQLEADTRVAERVDEARLRYFVDRFRAMAAAHGHDMPNTGRQATALEGDPVHLANLALHRLRIWSARVDYVRAHLEHLRAEAHHLDLLAECLAAMRRAGLDLDGLFQESRFLCKCLFACPRGGADTPEIRQASETVIEGDAHDFIYIASLHEQRHMIRAMVVEHGCEQMGIPAWLTGDPRGQADALDGQRQQLLRDLADLEAELRALRADPDVAAAGANIDTLHWYLEHAAGHLTATAHCHLTGWTTARDVRILQQALDKAGIRAIIRSPRPPGHMAPPVATLDTWWARPFQPIVGLWGTPGRREVDPTGLLALVVPLLFGYMFPDVGHGLMLILFALAASGRWPKSRFLLPCGVAAMGFGFLFGDVFGLHGLLRPIWTHPLDDPVAILAIPLWFGAGLMLLGLVFAGIEARWRGELRQWLWADGAVLLLYVSALCGLWLPWTFWITGLAGLFYLAGAVLTAPAGDRLAALPQALGDLLLSSFELAMNTLSFLRVGAFALAHTALSQAVVGLSEAVDSAWATLLILVLGNLFSVVLEGLLVFVQTTRLVLFEFFIHFLRADGRLFRPDSRSR